MTQVFAPGCALMVYKPDLAQKVNNFLQQELGALPQHLTCCRHEPHLAAGTQVINICAGCDRRYRSLYEGVSTTSLWEIIANSKNFEYPNYNGMKMSIHDACPTRTEARVHDAVRTLLKNMNIEIVEAEYTRDKAVCCGDSFYGTIPAEQVKVEMKKRADQMPCEDVVIYCVSCIKAMYIGGKKPRYLVDLLFGEQTSPAVFEPDAWHTQLEEFVSAH